MDINNVYALIGFMLLSVGVLLELSLLPRMLRELRKPRDGFTRMRWYVLARPLTYVMTFTPFSWLLFRRIETPPATSLGAWVMVSVPFGLLTLAIFTYLAYTYKEKE